MAEREDVLKIPEGVSSEGMVKDLGEAYLKAMVALPEILVGMANVIEELRASVDMIALYFERKGIADDLIKEEDLDKEGEAEDGEGEPE